VGFRNPIRRLSELVADRVIGALVATAETGIRTAMQGNGLKFYSGDPAETTPASIAPGVAGSGVGELRLTGADMGGGILPAIILQTQDVIGGFLARIFIGTEAGNSLVSIGSTAGQVILTGQQVDLSPTGVGAGNGVKIGSGGSRIKEITTGSTAVTTNGAARASFPHGMAGGAPARVFFTLGNYTAFIRVISTDATNVTIELRDDANVLQPATTRTLDWWAVR
jgi:hypothetical protein